MIYEEFRGELWHRCGPRHILRPLPCYGCGAAKPVQEEMMSTKEQEMRTFATGATRNQDETKLDGEGFYHPIVVERFAQYLHKHRKQADGNLRDSDNWQKGMPITVYMKSAWRHFLAWWKAHRGYKTDEDIEDSICGLIFNAQGYLYELLKDKLPKTGTKVTLVKVNMPDNDPALLNGLDAQPGQRMWTGGPLTMHGVLEAVTPKTLAERELP